MLRYVAYAVFYFWQKGYFALKIKIINYVDRTKQYAPTYFQIQ